MGEEESSDGKLWGVMKMIKPYVAVIFLQFSYGGLYTLSLVSLQHGMSPYVLSVYRHLVAVVSIAPFALILERNIRPKMTLPIFLRIMGLGLLEPVIDQNLYNLGMKYTSATYGSAIVNVLPAVTFLMAILFRLESVNFGKIQSQAKVIGTILTVAGATMMTLYKGPIVNIFFSLGKLHHHTTASSDDKHWLIGTLFLVISACAWAGFFILQSFTLELYPTGLSLTALTCFTGMLQGAVVTLVMERNFNVWVIGWDSRLLAVVYSGVVCSSIGYYVIAVVNKERGPVFVTAFIPLCTIITAALGALILAEKIHLGSLIGAIVIVIGLYSVLWGKSKDHVVTTLTPSSNEKASVLPVINDGEHLDKAIIQFLDVESTNNISPKAPP